MVALRGKKAKATTAKPKPAAAAKSSSSTAPHAPLSVSQQQQQQEQTQQRQEQEFLQLLRFIVHSTLVLRKLPQDTSIDAFCSTMLTVLCSSSKERHSTPAQILSKLTLTERKRVCGAIFSADEIAYSCRNCQIDSTCVTCRDCFTHSDHTGHDVYFQRTTAGSSCDCGDPQAWKRSGFCVKHPGVEDADGGVAKKHKLPKHIQQAAPTVIDTLVDYVFQTLLAAEYSLEFAEALEVFSRNIPPQILSEIGVEEPEKTNTGTDSAGSLTSASSVSRNLRSSRNATESKRSGKSKEVGTSKRNPESPIVPLAIRLHNDDVHTLTEVTDILCSILDCSKATARGMVHDADRVGDTVVAKRPLLKLAGIAGSLSRKSLNISVAPAWWEQQMQNVSSVIEWLHYASTSSDELAGIISMALQQERNPEILGFKQISGELPKGKIFEQLLKDQNIRLHDKASDMCLQLIDGSRDVLCWALEQESAQSDMYKFASLENAESSSALVLAQGNSAKWNNLFIEKYIKTISLSRSYSHHQSVRDGIDSLIAKFCPISSSKASSKLTTSALVLLVRQDCLLRKRSAELSHILLREHLLEGGFRTSMLEAYVRSYPVMTSSYLRGLGNSSDSIFDFAVQFLTVPNLVKQYTRRETELHPERPQIVNTLLTSLEIVFKAALNPQGIVFVDHPALHNQKYKHCIDNLEYVFNIGAIPNELVCDLLNLDLWLSCLKTLQNGDLQARRGINESHVEYESDSWLSMFNLGIRVHSIFPVAWAGFQPSVLQARQLSLVDIFKPIVEAAVQKSSALNANIPKKLVVPVSKISTQDAHQTMLTYDFKVASQPTSLHIPLHRFLAASIRHACIYQNGFLDQIDSDKFLDSFGFSSLSLEARLELVEMPLRCLVMASQIHSNLWRRNGDENMLAQLYNYSALPYCIHYRDADTFMMQLGVLLIGPDYIVSKMMDRFQVGTYFTLSQDGTSSVSDESEHMGYAPLEPGIDEQQKLQMVEEFMRLIIIIGTTLPTCTGKSYEEEFLKEEMLQHLCAKSYAFSKLFDLAILPSGQDDISIPRLEEVLMKVSNFVPPTGLESGRYELKEGLLENYNPYFLHLNRESHELARDRWTSFRKACYKKQAAGAAPKQPLKPMNNPVHFMRPAQGVLVCDSTITVVQTVLWRILHGGESSTSSATGGVSDAVISTCLHLLVHGVHTAIAATINGFWERLCVLNQRMDNLSLVHLLRKLQKEKSTLLDGEQSGTLEWLIWKINESSPKCRDFLQQIDQEVATGKSQALSVDESTEAAAQAPALTLDQRKAEARKRALSMMAKQQAAFQAMMTGIDSDDDEKSALESSRRDSFSEDDRSTESGPLGKRRAPVETDDDDEVKKRQKIEVECPKCILCHDTSAQAEMGMAAYVHQSTVLAANFRPYPAEALGSNGKKVRSQVKDIIEKMELCSGGPGSSMDMAPSPTLRALTNFPDWYIDDDAVSLDGTFPHLHTGNQRRQRNHHNHNHTHAHDRHLPMLEGDMLHTEDEMDVLEGVLNMREDQRLFPMAVRNAIGTLERGPRGPQVVRGGVPPIGHVHRGLGFNESDDSDDDDDEFRPEFHLDHAPPGFANPDRECAKLYLTPCGLHIRTCQHAVHIHCLERYISSLHDKAIRGEEFDGAQAIDPDSAMTQFLCPLCKTLCNFLIPTSDPTASSEEDNKSRAIVQRNDISSSWHSIIEEQIKIPGWYRAVLGRDGDFNDHDGDDAHDLWRDYFEETLWEPHGSLEKGAPFLWSSCAFSIASFLLVAEEEHRSASGSLDAYDPLKDPCPSSLEKEFASISAVTKFCRWSFSLLEHSADAKVIWETSKRCCPINIETTREYRKFTKVLGSIDVCLRGTILGLLIADTFTAFVISSVIAADPITIWRFIPVFSVADIIQRIYTEFFDQKKADEASLFQDKYSIANHKHDETSASADDVAPRRTRSGRSIEGGSSPAAKTSTSQSSRAVVSQAMEKLERAGDQNSDAFAVLQIMLRIIAQDPSARVKSISKSDLEAGLERIITANAQLVRRMKLLWKCLSDQEPFEHQEPTVIPSISEIASSSDVAFQQIWKWCWDRMNSKNHLGSTKAGDKCEHTDGCSEAYVASMFILRECNSNPKLIDLPAQYDELYSQLAGRKCDRCNRVPTEPAICLVCGEYLCCGDSCCTRPFISHGPPVGECTRHAAECGGGIGIILMLDQCRVSIIGGSMAAYFPSPYVDAHGEEDVGLQRGRPLRLDTGRYRALESLWLNHRIFTEVSRQRNQREAQYTINLSYL